MRIALLGVLWAAAAFPASQTPIQEMTLGAVRTPNERIPEYRHGYVIVYRGKGALNSFSAYGPDGNLAFEKVIELPGGGSQDSVADVDFDADGNAAVAASAVGSTPCMLHGVLLLDRSGRQTRFIDTGCYVVTHIAIAPDHSIWTLGWQRDTSGMAEDRRGYMIVRSFTVDGRQANAVLPRSSFPKGLEPGAAGGEARIEVTQDRVGVLVYSGISGSNREWVELDLSGNLRNRSRIDEVASPALVAFTTDDHVYLQARGFGEVYSLDPVSHTTKTVDAQGSTLMGADGNELVYQKACCGPIQLQWFLQP